MNEGFDLASFALLAAAEERNFWFVSRNELIRWLVGQYAARAARVLELGCGTGFALTALRVALPRARIAGSELHSRGLGTARGRHGKNVELIQLAAPHCHVAATLALVCAFDVLEHIPEDDLVLAEIRRILKPGGMMIATVPQHPWMWSTADDVALHQRRYRRGELARKAVAAGLRPLYQTSFTTLSFPLMAVRRAPARKVAGGLREQLNISPIGGMLLGLACMEQGRAGRAAVRRLADTGRAAPRTPDNRHPSSNFLPMLRPDTCINSFLRGQFWKHWRNRNARLTESCTG